MFKTFKRTINDIARFKAIAKSIATFGRGINMNNAITTTPAARAFPVMILKIEILELSFSGTSPHPSLQKAMGNFTMKR
jgi:hypothetical protein